MGLTVAWHDPYAGPRGEAGWRLLSTLREPRLVAKSRTTVTESGLLDLPAGPVEVFRKRYLYPGARAKARGMLRTTLAGPGRAAAEAAALLRLQALGLAPDPVAHAARRTLGFLDEAILVTRAVPGGRDLASLPPSPALATAVGTAVGRMHAAGFGRLDLAPRNLVVGRGSRVLKVDSGRMRRVRRGGRDQREDLAELLGGVSGWPQASLDALLESYASAVGRSP